MMCIDDWTLKEDGEYLCCFERRRIRIVKKIATMKEAEETIRSIVSRPQE